MMNPVVRVMLQRAESRRHSLLDLARVIPDGYFERVSPGEDWNARDHLAHALAADHAIAGLVALASEGAPPAALGAALSEIATTRTAVIQEKRSDSLSALFDESVKSRRLLAEALSRLEPLHLEAVIPIPGANNAWGQPLGISVLVYLEQWANHDAVHEQAIREAIATKPDLSTVALTRRIR